MWALGTGTVVIYLARERYGFVQWVAVFLGLTWASTMFFGRQRSVGKPEEEDRRPRPPGLVHEVTSYVTRIMYQETLFFLLPFYAYSTVVGSPNVLFVGLLGALAVLSCLDLLFDRWLRTKPVFGLVFFSIVAFAAINLLLPLFFRLPPRFGTPLAGLMAVGGGVPLALRSSAGGRGGRVRLGITAVGLLAIAIGFPSVVPPVPLRLERATFAGAIDRETLTLHDTLTSPVPARSVQGPIIVLAQVFAPTSVPTRVTMDWERDGVPLRQSRNIELVAHAWGFRVWDSWRPPSGAVPPGTYRVTLRTAGHRVFAVARLVVEGR